jgi:hypothetical protein
VNVSMMIIRPPQRGQASDVVGAVATGKQPIVTNAVEALGEDVHQKAPDELARGERHRLPAIRPVEAIVLPAKGDATVVGGDQPPVGDGDAVVNGPDRSRAGVRGPAARVRRTGRYPTLANCYSVDARAAMATPGANASCVRSISSKVRPLGSNPNAQNPITPRIYHAAK